MRSSKVLSSLLLVGALTLAAPAVASAHQEGRANCRYTAQQSTTTQLTTLGWARQAVGGTVAGIATSLRELDRTVGRILGQAGGTMTGIFGAAGETTQLVRATVSTFGSWGPTRVLPPR
jgi:hypothetical protein